VCENNASLLKEAWETLDNAKHELMDGEVKTALKDAVRAAREALTSLLNTKPTHELSETPLTTLYDAVRALSGGNEAWESLILRCVKLLDEAGTKELVTPEDVEDFIACAEEVINWVEAFSQRLNHS